MGNSTSSSHYYWRQNWDTIGSQFDSDRVNPGRSGRCESKVEILHRASVPDLHLLSIIFRACIRSKFHFSPLEVLKSLYHFQISPLISSTLQSSNLFPFGFVCIAPAPIYLPPSSLLLGPSSFLPKSTHLCILTVQVAGSSYFGAFRGELSI